MSQKGFFRIGRWPLTSKTREVYRHVLRFKPVNRWSEAFLGSYCNEKLAALLPEIAGHLSEAANSLARTFGSKFARIRG